MRTFKTCFVFIIIVVEMILAEHEHKMFFEQLRILHNEMRRIHGAGELELVKEMSMDALVYANRWKRGETNIFVKNEKYGFNTFSKFISTKKLDAALVFMEWYNQCKNYDYNKEPLNNDESASFTQIVWKSTEKMGLAMVKNNGIVMVVAVYSPPGNIENEYLLNV